MKDSLTWIIFGLGYIPMHFMMPLLLAFMTGAETPEERKALLRYLCMEGCISLVMVGLAAFLLLNLDTMYALTALLLGPTLPLAGLWLYRRRKGTAWTQAAND